MTPAHLSKSSFNQYPEYNCLNQMHLLVTFFFFIARVAGDLPSSTQNNIVASDYPLAWLLKKFKTNWSIVSLRIHLPLRNVVMDSGISWKICCCTLVQGWLFAATLRFFSVLLGIRTWVLAFRKHSSHPELWVLTTRLKHTDDDDDWNGSLESC